MRIIKKTTLVVSIAAFLLYCPLYLFAQDLPQGAKVIEGSVEIDNSSANTLKININSDKAIIEYNSFDIAFGQSVIFFRPNNLDYSVLNRVIGSSASNIAGTLDATNGYIYLINPNGINISSTANINAASFIASTLNLENNNFVSGSYIFSKWVDKVGKSVINNGYIKVREGGKVALLGSAVANAGTIEATLGQVILAAGEAVTLNLDSVGMISVVIDKGVQGKIYDANGNSIRNAISNSGIIISNGGKVLLTTKVLNQAFDNAINNSGLIQANALVNHDGLVELVSSGATTMNSGIIDTPLLKEKGQSFTTTGTIKGGFAYYDNEDGAANIGGNIGSNQSDTGNLNVISDIILTANNLIFTAGTSGVGSFISNGYSINSGGTGSTYRGLTISAASDSTLGVIGNSRALANLTLSRTAGAAGTPTFTMEGNAILRGNATLTVGDSTILDPGSYTISPSSGSGTGILGVTGKIKVNASTFTGNYSSFDSIIFNTGSTVDYCGVAQVLRSGTYYNLITSGSDTKTLSGRTTVNNNLIVGSGSNLDIGANSVTVNGLSTINGTVTFSSTSGTKIFAGDVILNSGGVWDEVVAESITFGGNLQNDGIFNANTGTHTFTGTAKIISGSNSISIPRLTINGTVTNNGILNVSKTLSGSGTLTNGSGATLNIGATSVSSALTLVATASNNTVNYNGASQTIKLIDYYNLIVSGSGTKTLTGDISLTNLTVDSGTVMNPKGHKITGINLDVFGTIIADLDNLTDSYSFAVNTLKPNSTVQYSRSGAQNIADLDYYNLKTSGSGTKTLTGDISLTNLIVGAKTVINPNSYKITGIDLDVFGTILADLTSFVDNYDFATRAFEVGSTVKYSRAGTQDIAAFDYYNLSLSGNNVKTLSGDIDIVGNLAIGSGVTLDVSLNNYNIDIEGNWTNSGIFTARSGTVTFKGTSQSDIKGNNKFYNLTIDTTTDGAKTVRFGAGRTQTVINNLILTGALGKTLTIRSTTDGSQATISIPSSISTGVAYIDVKDVKVSGTKTITALDSINSGNNVNWLFTSSDITSPETNFLTAPGDWINTSSVTITWTGSDNITLTGALLYSYQLDSAVWSSFGSSTTLSLAGLSEGSHTFSVKAQDAAGNIDLTPAQVTFGVDTIAPVINISSPENGITYNNPQTLSYTVLDNLTATPDVTGPVSGTVYNIIGNYGVSITAKDLAGNEAVQSLSFRLEATPGQQSQLLSITKPMPLTLQQLQQYLVNFFAPRAPVYFYHPLTPVDIQAFEEFQLDENAYDFMNGVLNLNGHDGLLPFLNPRT